MYMYQRTHKLSEEFVELSKTIDVLNGDGKDYLEIFQISLQSYD